MTKKIVWRLKEVPTSEKIALLVERHLLTNDEAREILFKSETEEDRDKKSLESEIKFLRELVEKLSQDKSRIIEVIREIEKPYYPYRWWRPYDIWCGGTTGGNFTCSNGVATGNLVMNAAMNATSNFSDIKTF